MDGDGSDFTFSSASEYLKGQDANDISWADIFLDGIHSDDAIAAESGALSAGSSNLGAGIHGTAQQMHHQAQQSMMGGQLQIHIPAQLQGSIANNAVQQGGTNLCGTVAYLTPSASSHQYVNAAGGIHNVMTVSSHHPTASSVGQQHQQNQKLLHIAPSFPMTQMSNSVPLQTLLQPSQNQAIYGSQGAGMFPAQGSVHIENPKVVNVNFGPHVIGSDGGSQQTIFQTAEGKRVYITNSQLQQMSQSISLTQPLVGTQLINTTGGNVIRTNLAQGTHTIMPGNAGGQSQQIVLPSGQTVISQQTNSPHGTFSKNVVLNSLGSNMSPLIYQSGQGGQLIHSQPTLVSGPGLQVVNAGGGQGNQLQLITQSSINQPGMGQQGTVMNLVNNSAVLPGSGLVPGQNIFVNGQMLNLGQLRSLAMPQLHMQRNSQGGITLSDFNAVVTCAGQFQPSAPQLVIQHNGQQQQILLQSRSNPSSSITTNTAQSQRLVSSVSGYKSARTPTPNASSASSTPVLTPTPSTPTPTPTPELLSDFPGSKGNQGINILKQALDMSNIDLDSFEDDISFLESSADCFSLFSTQPPSLKPVTKLAKSKSKATKPKLKCFQQFENVTVNNTSSPFPQTTQFQNTHEQKVNPGSQQKIMAANGQVYVLSSHNQQLILQPSMSSASPSVAEHKPHSCLSAAGLDRTQASIPSSYPLDIKGFSQDMGNSYLDGQQKEISQDTYSNLDGRLKLKSHNSSQDRNVFIAAGAGRNVFIKTCPDETGTFQTEKSSIFPTGQLSSPDVSRFSSPVYQTSSDFNQLHVQNMKSQNALTSGTFLQQQPLISVIKQETFSDSDQSVPRVHNLPHLAGTVGTSHTALLTPTCSFGAMTTPNLILSPSFTTVITTTTQSHQNTIMSTAQMSGISSAGTYTSHSSARGDTSITGTYTSHSSAHGDTSVAAASMDNRPLNLSPTLFQSLSSSMPSSSPASAVSSSMDKDVTVKAATAIKVADSTLMLNLTQEQRQRLENQLARMSKKGQEGFLAHQQNVLQRSLQMQQTQLHQRLWNQQNYQPSLQERQSQESQQQQTDQEEISQVHQPYKQIQQLPQQQLYEPSQQQQQSPHFETCCPTATGQDRDEPELLPSRSVQAVPGGLPTTVQELVERSEEKELLLNYQTLSALRTSEQSQHQPYIHGSQHTGQSQHQPYTQQQQFQQHSYPNLHQRSASLAPSAAPVQQFMIPPMGRCLAEQQLTRDRILAVEPDVNNPFKSFSDAMRRLVRYHTLQDHKPGEGSKATRIWDSRYSKLCDYLVRKKRCYFRRFHKMRLYQDMCPEKQPDYIQNLMCFNEQLRVLIKSEKEGLVIRPDLLAATKPGQPCSSWSASPVRAGHDDTGGIRTTPGYVDKPLHNFILKDLSANRYLSQQPTAGSEKCEFSRKRAAPDAGSSSGMLKFVFKRRTNDNLLFVKSSLSSGVQLPRDLRPVVNLEKSDSEYEFDSNTADVACNQPVIVRRRTLSVASRQVSVDVGCDNDSVSSHNEEIHDNSSEEDGDETEEDDELEEEKSLDDSDTREFIDMKISPKPSYRVTFGDLAESKGSGSSSEDSDDEGSDAFMEEAEELVSSSSYHLCASSRTASLCADSSSSNLNTKGQPSHNACATSDNIFNPGLAYSRPLANKGQTSRHSTFYGAQGIDHQGFSLGTQVDNSASTPSHTALHDQEEIYVAESPVSNLEEEAARRGLPNCSLFTTPNKSLLKTDAMFNSEDEDEVRCGARAVPKFQIDNKDPQSNMIDESVRSVINSVLNNDGEDDDDDNKGSQASWVSSTSSSSSSSGHRNLFQPYSSIMIPSGCNRDLDLAAQSVINS